MIDWIKAKAKEEAVIEDTIEEKEDEALAKEEGDERKTTAVGMAATTTAAAVVQAVEAQAVQDMLKGTEESKEEISAKLAIAREKKLKTVFKLN